MSRSGAQRSARGGELAIADAVTDVAIAAEQVIADRVELLRLELHDDVRGLAIALAFGGVALAAGTVAIACTAAAVAWGLSVWLGMPGALAIVAALAAVLAWGLTTVARRHLTGTPWTGVQ